MNPAVPETNARPSPAATLALSQKCHPTGFKCTTKMSESLAVQAFAALQPGNSVWGHVRYFR